MKMTILIHVLGGGLALVSGGIALYAAKGAQLHRKSGMIFVAAMMTMSVTGAAVAAWTGVETSVIAGLLTAYLVITALTTVRRPAGGSRWIDLGPMLMGISVGLASIMIGAESVARNEMMRDGMPVPMLFVFGVIALSASLSDLRMLRAGGIQGVRRLARHLWRMCFALFIASASFFLGQSDKFPESLRIMPLLLVLALAPVALLLYWLWRVRLRKSFRGIARVNQPEVL